MARKSRKHLQTAVTAAAPATPQYIMGGYVRQSGDDSRKRGDTVESQRNIILNFLEDHPEIRLHEMYVDNHITGTNFERPEFQRMLADMESGKINGVIVKDLSRFGRNAIDTGYYVEKLLPSMNVRFIAVNDDYDSLYPQPGAGIMLPLKNMINEAYALDIGRKVKAVHLQNMKDGLFIGSHAPFGYMKAPDNCHKLIIDPETAPIIKQIFAWAYEGRNVSEITRNLNDNSVMTPSKYKKLKGDFKHPALVGRGNWQRATVQNILNDRVYAGDLVQGKTNKNNHKQRDNDPSTWITVENTHEPIIDRTYFNEVQRIMNEAANEVISKRAPTLPYTDSVFKGKVFCAHCGYAMHRHRTTTKNFVTYWFNCQTQVKVSKQACVQVSVKEEELKTTVLTYLQNKARVFTGSYINLQNKSLPIESAKMDAEIRAIRQQQDKDEGFLKSLYENLISGLITADEYRDMKLDYGAKIQANAARADELRNQKRSMESQAMEYKSLSDAVNGISCNDDLTAALIDKTVDRIEICRDKSITIHWKFTDEIYRSGGLALCANM